MKAAELGQEMIYDHEYVSAARFAEPCLLDEILIKIKMAQTKVFLEKNIDLDFSWNAKNENGKIYLKLHALYC